MDCNILDVFVESAVLYVFRVLSLVYSSSASKQAAVLCRFSIRDPRRIAHVFFVDSIRTPLFVTVCIFVFRVPVSFLGRPNAFSAEPGLTGL